MPKHEHVSFISVMAVQGLSGLFWSAFLLRAPMVQAVTGTCPLLSAQVIEESVLEVPG